MFKSLADRLAEAFAECLHHRVRTDLWGYAAGEQLSNDDMIAEKYRGIRPPRLPACPDHSAKTDLFRVLNAEEIGMGLTESLAMTPAASVSGFYIGHPTRCTSTSARSAKTSCTTWPSAGAWTRRCWSGCWRRICDAMNWIAACAYGTGAAAIFIDASCQGW